MLLKELIMYEPNERISESRKSDLPDIYLDMDGVLVDFITDADKVTGGFSDGDKDKNWAIIDNTRKFWENLSWNKGGKRLYDFVWKHDPHILSARSKSPMSVTGKMNWLKKNTNFPKNRIHIVFRSEKKNFSVTDGKANVLIDDQSRNIEEWNAEGGIGILHKNVNDTIRKLKDLGF